METPMVPANFSELAEKVRLGVVNIQVVKKVQNAGMEVPKFRGNPFGDRNPFGDFFGPFSDGTPPGGYIITNNHVVENADQIRVKFANGKEYDGKVVGRDSGRGRDFPGRPETGQRCG